MLSLIAPAKVNLCLHVGGTRPDGLHDLFSLAVFPDIGDRLDILPSDRLSLSISGPFASDLSRFDPSTNLVIRAARLLARETGCSDGAEIRLSKNLPAASGIGGGTSDAVTALVLLRRLWGVRIDDAALSTLAFQIGADGPLCLMPHLSGAGSAVMTGAGETVRPGPKLPPLWICLVNPREQVSTGVVFREFDEAGPAGPADRMVFATHYRSAQDFAGALASTRNDLTAYAVRQCRAIERGMAFLAGRPGCLFSGMSGSGATSFGLFNSRAAALQAAGAARGLGWWSEAASIVATGAVRPVE